MTTSVGDFLNDASEIAASESGREVTFATFQRRNSQVTEHGNLAIGAVRLVLNLAIRQPTKQDAAMLRVFVRNRFLFKCFAKTLNFVFQLLIVTFKPIIFLFETLELFSELDKPFFQNRGAATLVDEFVDGGQQVCDHGLHSGDQGT